MARSASRPGVRDGSFSPDGAKLAYSLIDGGILIRDLATGEDLPVPGTASDFNPSGRRTAQGVFNRGMGIFDLFIVNLDGSNLRQITHGGVQEWPVGWLEDGSFLYTVPGREYEYIVYRLDLASGESPVFSNENIQSLSPDGQYVAIARLAFGERWQIDISRLDGADRWALANDSLWVLNPLWSASGGGCWPVGHRLGFYHRRADQPAHLPVILLPAPRRQPPRLEAVRFPFSPGGLGQRWAFAPTAISALVGSVI